MAVIDKPVTIVATELRTHFSCDATGCHHVVLRDDIPEGWLILWRLRPYDGLTGPGAGGHSFDRQDFCSPTCLFVEAQKGMTLRVVVDD